MDVTVVPFHRILEEEGYIPEWYSFLSKALRKEVGENVFCILPNGDILFTDGAYPYSCQKEIEGYPNWEEPSMWIEYLIANGYKKVETPKKVRELYELLLWTCS